MHQYFATQYAQRFFFLLLGIMLASSSSLYATHIRAGEIIVERNSCQGFTYTVTVVGYTDTGSDVDFGRGILDFSFGPSIELSTGSDFSEEIEISNDNQIARSTFVTQMDFPGPGTYTVTFRELNRNADIVNIPESVNTPFYIETQVRIIPLVCNESPVFLNPPIDGASVGNTFTHIPGGFDPDGDSLSYELVFPKEDRDSPVIGYQYPDEHDINLLGPDVATNQAGTAPATTTIDPVTGELVWDAPAYVNNSVPQTEYNVAFIMREWRKINGEWVELGYITRDMQIIVDDADNEPPELAIPADTCIEAGTLLEAQVTGTDPDGDDVLLSAFGGVFELRRDPAVFTPLDTPQPTPATGNFSWQTSCDNVRAEPYQVNFKVADVNPASGPSLADFAIWNVTVVASAPTGLTAAAANDPTAGRGINLNWDPYACREDDSVQLQVWRKVDSTDFVPENCQVGIPPGYELVASVDQGVISYRDDSVGPGANYCYRLVAVFPDGAESYASAEACAEMAVDAPVITKVSVTATDEADGSIQIDWRSPFEIDQALFPPPYQYQVVRSTGFGPGNEEVVASGIIGDTTFTDTGLNTLEQPYSYTVYLFDADGGDPIDSSAVASSVFLEPTPNVGSIDLDWTASVPWSNVSPDYPYHYIYRSQVELGNPETLVLIDSVNVLENGLTYTDDGRQTGEELSDEIEYCYFVTTFGSYGNDKLNPPPLINNSQVACAQPNDTIPPCEPVAIMIPNASVEDCKANLAGLPCDFSAFTNRLEWEDNTAEACDNDVRSYNIYFAASDQDSALNLIGSTQETFFEHGDLSSLAGCYRISAVDRSGNESPLSEPVCVENCPNYELPNIFTPNADNHNDTFRPFDGTDGDFSKCPRFVEQVALRVYNRWGKEVYDFTSGENENSIFIDWDGRTDGGNLLAPGLYYYTAEVNFITLDPALRQRTIKGWVQIMYTQDDL